MLGAVAGDIIGSVYEARPIKTTRFPLFNSHARFTDDTVLTIAVADSLLHNTDYATSLRTYGRLYPRAGYGTGFLEWLFTEDAAPYNSWGNGSAMRVSPIGFAFNTIESVLAEAKKSAEVTHNHAEGINGAQATAAAVFLARKGKTKQEITAFIAERFSYDLYRSLEQIRPCYRFDVSCRGSVPEAIIAFLESRGYEDAVRNAVSLGGDSDTMACIAGGIAQAFYGAVPDEIVTFVRNLLPDKFLLVLDEFNKTFI